jgi:hypothetical protein
MDFGRSSRPRLALLERSCEANLPLLAAASQEVVLMFEAARLMAAEARGENERRYVARRP